MRLSAINPAYRSSRLAINEPVRAGGVLRDLRRAVSYFSLRREARGVGFV